MNERPILFSGPMVRAILEGRKTQTRRIVKPQPIGEFDGPKKYNPSITNRRGDMRPGPERFGIFDTCGEWSIPCPYGQPGDRLWVRETWACIGLGKYAHRATDESNLPDIKKLCNGWKPSIHMPRCVSRLTLEITFVDIEPLQSIIEHDARSEGYPGNTVDGQYVPWSPFGWFMSLWQSINGIESWDANPWVWVIGFERVTP
jgi:hypothetical protein